MTAASPEPREGPGRAPASGAPPQRARRRARYRRAAPGGDGGGGGAAGRPFALTPARLALLCHLADCPYLSLPQLAWLLRPGDDPGARAAREKSARRAARAAFDAGLVDVIAAGRAALAEHAAAVPGPGGAGAGAADPAALLFGSAPNVYALAPAGAALLARCGFPDVPARGHHRGRSGGAGAVAGPGGALFLAHALAVADVRVWLERSAAAAGAARDGGGGDGMQAAAVLRWRAGADAAIGLGRADPPLRVLPDAWFACRLARAGADGGADGGPPPVLVGLVEADRGTERPSGPRWREKVAAYAALFAGDAAALRAATGYARARVLVVTPDAARRDALARVIAEAAPSPLLAQRFWLAERAALAAPDPAAPAWRQAGSELLRGLLGPGTTLGTAP